MTKTRHDPWAPKTTRRKRGPAAWAARAESGYQNQTLADADTSVLVRPVNAPVKLSKQEQNRNIPESQAGRCRHLAIVTSIASAFDGQTPHQRQHAVDGRCRLARQTAKLLDGGDERIDLHRATAFEVLQHRRLVLADIAGALDAAVDRDRKAHAEALTNRLRFQH